MFMENALKIGEKIRALRRQEHMTQAALAGTEITRNMLSRIETGAVLPSLPTLLYLADRLKTPAGYFLDDEASLLSCRKERFMPAIRDQFRRGNHKEVLRLWKKHLGQTDDEIAFLLAESCIGCAYTAMYEGALATAAAYLSDALSFAEKTIFPTDAVKAKAELIRTVVSNVQSPRFELDEKKFLTAADTAIYADLYHYLTEKYDGYVFRNPQFEKHIQAKQMMKAGRYRDAIVALEELENQKSNGMGAFLLFRVYTDIEHCQKELRDYESAYRYSGKRISLLSAFRS